MYIRILWYAISSTYVIELLKALAFTSSRNFNNFIQFTFEDRARNFDIDISMFSATLKSKELREAVFGFRPRSGG